MREKLESCGYSVTRYGYPPGTHFPDHTHEVDKIHWVLSGQFRITVEGAAVILAAGDAVAVPIGAVQALQLSVTNPSSAWMASGGGLTAYPDYQNPPTDTP